MLLKADGAIHNFSYFNAPGGDDKEEKGALPMYPHVAAEAYQRKLKRQESFV